ncbi:carbohydrate ABC transporter permease [Thiospirochaeta perfilievii]|uniref:carbohydrate ABC transporter permease n=1 Tax=Thiospirochaeta perfilievii TaxID=252967 RepID=UPI001FF06386|nr:sugar ABC transporter permease [Thiospirochaeta perfilievii]
MDNLIRSRNSTFFSKRGFKWFLYLLPALVFYTGFMAYPILNSIKLSFFSETVQSGQDFVGFNNYIKLFTHPGTSERYWSAFRNTWLFFGVHMVVQNVLGIIFANFLSDKLLRGSGFFRTIIFLPATLSILVTGYIWKLILNPQWGAVNLLLKNIGFEDFSIAWLGEPKIALIVISLVSSWQWVGMPTMMFLAGLNNIPEDLYEAAEISGATDWQVFWFIKLPLLKPVIGIITILTFVNNFNAFDVVFSMANVNGAPAYSTDILGTFFYRVGIAGQHPVGIPDKGLGAAVATITFILLSIGVALIMRATGSNRGGSND